MAEGTTSPIDIERARRETPGCAEVAHLNNAGSALPSAPVVEAQLDWIRREALMGGYEIAAAEADRVSSVHDSVARLIGAKREEIAVVEHASVAWLQAFWAFRFGEGDRILTSEIDYGANFVAYLQAVAHNGAELVVIPSDPATGLIDLAALETELGRGASLVAVTHIPTNGGAVNPAAEIGALANAAGVPFLLDACQSAGQLPLDVDALGCDLLSATGRKYLRGPRGTGFLYVRSSLLDRLEPPLLDHFGADWTSLDTYRMRDDARRFEWWEYNYAARVGLGVAVDYALDWGLEAIEERVRHLGRTLRNRLTDAGAEVHDLGAHPCGIVTFTLAGHDATALKELAGQAGVNVSVTTPDSTLVDATRRGLTDMVRASVHYYNTESEIDTLINALPS